MSRMSDLDIDAHATVIAIATPAERAIAWGGRILYANGIHHESIIAASGPTMTITECHPARPFFTTTT